MTAFVLNRLVPECSKQLYSSWPPNGRSPRVINRRMDKQTVKGAIKREELLINSCTDRDAPQKHQAEWKRPHAREWFYFHEVLEKGKPIWKNSDWWLPAGVGVGWRLAGKTGIREYAEVMVMFCILTVWKRIKEASFQMGSGSHEGGALPYDHSSELVYSPAGRRKTSSLPGNKRPMPAANEKPSPLRCLIFL